MLFFFLLHFLAQPATLSTQQTHDILAQLRAIRWIYYVYYDLLLVLTLQSLQSVGTSSGGQAEEMITSSAALSLNSQPQWRCGSTTLELQPLPSSFGNYQGSKLTKHVCESCFFYSRHVTSLTPCLAEQTWIMMHNLASDVYVVASESCTVLIYTIHDA